MIVYPPLGGGVAILVLAGYVQHQRTGKALGFVQGILDSDAVVSHRTVGRRPYGEQVRELATQTITDDSDGT